VLKIRATIARINVIRICFDVAELLRTMGISCCSRSGHFRSFHAVLLYFWSAHDPSNQFCHADLEHIFRKVLRKC
jgi:hypothetical protein